MEYVEKPCRDRKHYTFLNDFPQFGFNIFEPSFIVVFIMRCSLPV